MKTAIEIGEEMINARPIRPMTDDETRIMIGCLMFQEMLKLGIKEVIDKFLNAPQPISFQVLKKRLDFHHVDYDLPAVAFAAAISDRMGTCVLYAAVFAALAKRKATTNQTRLPATPVTLDDFCRAFPDGFPTEEAIHKVWLGQKIKDGQQPDNMLDREACWSLPS